MSVRRVLRYYVQWGAFILVRPWNTARQIMAGGAILSFVIILLDPYVSPHIRPHLPEWGLKVSDVVWWASFIAVIFFILSAIVRFFYFPYYAQEEQRQESEKETKELRQKVAEIEGRNKELTAPRTSIPALALGTQNDMTVRLRDLITPLGGEAKVIVEPTTAAARSFALSLVATFGSAGWKTEFRDPFMPRIPWYGYRPPSGPGHDGIALCGHNHHLVMAVKDILTTAGCTKIPAVTTVSKLEKNTPKWDQAQRFIHVHIGYRH